MRRQPVAAAGLLALLSLAVVSAQRPAAVVDVQILAFNDFHGHVEPVSGSNGRIGTTDAGGIEFLATHIARLKATNPNTIVVSAGDNIGASPFLSSMFHDEPTIEGLWAAGLQVSAVGNHELDEGWWELLRMQRGGCHQTDGCQDGTPFEGAGFDYVSANITLDPRRVDPTLLEQAGWARSSKRPATLVPAYTVKTVAGVKIGIIGVTVRTAPEIIAATSVKGLTFTSEARAANKAARALEREGVRAIIVVIHEGGDPQGDDYNGCANVTGPIMPIVRDMTDDVAVVVSGHSHHAYNCTVGRKLVTSAKSYGRLITDIDLQIDSKSGRVISKRAHNVIVTRDVTPDERQTAIIARYRPLAARVGSRRVGAIADTIDRTANAAGEHALGDVVADSMLEAAQAMGTRVDVAMTNPGGIRADLTRPRSGPQSGPIDVTYADAFAVLPFGNVTVVKTITGAELSGLLEQQFDNPSQGMQQILQVSRGFSYAYDTSRPAGQRVDRASVMLNGRTVGPKDSVRFATVDFIWGGGDGFKIAASSAAVVSAGDALDGLTSYLQRHAPVTPGPRDRIRKVE